MDANTTDDEVRTFLTYVLVEYGDAHAEQMGLEIRRKIGLKETFDEFGLLWEKVVSKQKPMSDFRFNS
jgi:hypothetical protein